MQTIPLGLTMEQQFNLRMYEEQVRSLSAEEAQGFLLELMRQLMIKNNVVAHLMKENLR